MADALAAMDYLLKRELMCHRCGIKLSVWENTNHAYCEDHKPPHGEYHKVKPPNELERRLCKAIGLWLRDTPDTSAESGDVADAVSDTSQSKPQELHPGDMDKVVPSRG